jgi:serine/threonine protein phosphatase PrpC
MDNAQKVRILGREHEIKAEVYSQLLKDANIAFGLSVGVASKPNEDCIGVSVLGSETVLAIADGHWGYDASEIAIGKAVDLLGPNLRPSKDSETRARLFALFEQINVTLFEMAMIDPGAPTPETTLIVCHVKATERGKYLYWSSFGDSFLFILRGRTLKQLNTLNPFWLGMLSKLSETAASKKISIKFLSDAASYVGVASGLESGIEKLESQDILFLCTDGLIGSDKEPDESVLNLMEEMLYSASSLESRVEKIIRSALSRGEEDNISCVIAQIS